MNGPLPLLNLFHTELHPVHEHIQADMKMVHERVHE